jgi:phage tail sheath protein FI
MSSYLRELHARGSIYDYCVVCDERNNTPQTVDNGELLIDVYFKPARTTKPISLKGVVSSSDVSIDEVLDEFATHTRDVIVRSHIKNGAYG